MNQEESKLWDRIKDFEIDDPSSDYTFTDRLVRENNWPYKYAIRVIEEYKKYIFLICNASTSLTPSDQVDQVWHLHLLYTESYWLGMCRDILFKDIHHGPTRGGKMESDKYQKLYSTTLDLYKQFFLVEPPKDIWPSQEIRFRKASFQRVNLENYYLIRKPFV